QHPIAGSKLAPVFLLNRGVPGPSLVPANAKLTRQLLQKPFEMHAANRVLQLADSFRLDLANALASDLEDAADLFQRVGVAVLQAVAETNDLALAPSERLEQAFDFLPQNALIGAVHRVI